MNEVLTRDLTDYYDSHPGLDVDFPLFSGSATPVDFSLFSGSATPVRAPK